MSGGRTEAPAAAGGGGTRVEPGQVEPGPFSLAEGALTASHYSAIVESSDDAILTKDENAIIRSWNPAAERLYGYTPEEAVGQPISMLIPAHRAGEERRILEQILAGDRVDHYETERVRRDGSEVVVSLSVSPLRDADDEIVGASVIARDITAQRRAAERAEHLQSIAAALSKEITPRRVVEVLLAEALPALGAVAGTIGILNEAGDEIELVESVGYSERGLARWGSFPLDAQVPMAQAIRERRAIWSTSREQLAREFPQLDEATLRFGALVVAPLVASDRAFGAIALSFRESRTFDEEERAFMLATTRLTAQALERASAYEEERRMREQLAFLADASELLSGSLDLDATLERLVFLAVPRVADWCAVHLAEDSGEIRNVAVAHADPARLALARELQARYPPDPNATAGVPKVIRSGRPELYPEISDELLEAVARDEEHLRMIRSLEIVSSMIVPLQAHGRTLGALTIMGAESGRRFAERDLVFAEDLAHRAALAVDNAILYRREHDAAVTLQRALLPSELPEVPGTRLAARYLPAATGFEVGGDWYDVAVAGDRVHVMVGDVAGRGVPAASIMGQLNTALRAYAADGHSPAASLDRLNRLMLDLDRPELATAFHLSLHLPTLDAQFTRAGHPPAFVVDPDGGVEELAGEGSPPLGVLPDAIYRDNRTQLRPGSLVVLFTDGLVERRGEGIEPGVQDLRRALADCGNDPETCVETIVSRMAAADLGDDVAILAMAIDSPGSTPSP